MLGWHISDTEDYEAQYLAYRMAIQTSKHKPYEIVHDNQGGHKKLDADGLFKKLCHVHRTTQPYNGESKTIEAVFGRFQQQVLHKDWRFTGQNITAKKMASRPNLEFIEANKDALYTLEELQDAYAKATKEWNEMAHPAYGKSRQEAYDNSVNEETQPVTAHDMVDMFWVTAKRMSTFTDQGISVTIKKQKRQYEVMSQPGVPDHEWRRQHTYERFVVKYDPYDFGSVRLYKKEADGSLRFERVAEPYVVIHRAIQEQTTGEAAFIRHEQTANTTDRIERTVAGREIEKAHGVMPEQHGLRSPKPKGMTAAERRQIERRTGIYSQAPEEYKIGRKTKQVSLEDWAQVETAVVDMAYVAGKS
nr:MAG TPA: transposase [Caudoviricetes sp.]